MLGNFGDDSCKFLGFLLAFPVSCLAISQRKEKPPLTVPVGMRIVRMKNTMVHRPSREGNGKIPKWLKLEDPEECNVLCFSTSLCGYAQDKSISHKVPVMNWYEAATHSGKITHLSSILLNHRHCAFSYLWEFRIWVLRPTRLHLNPLLSIWVTLANDSGTLCLIFLILENRIFLFSSITSLRKPPLYIN